MQRVEEKVRIELAAQRRELGAHAERVGVRGAGLLLRAAACAIRITYEPAAMNAVDEEPVEHLKAGERLRRGPRARQADLRRDLRDLDAEPRERRHRADDKVNGDGTGALDAAPLEQAVRATRCRRRKARSARRTKSPATSARDPGSVFVVVSASA